MSRPALPGPGPEGLVCYFPSGDVMRSRSVGAMLPAGTLDIPAPPPALVADWLREAVRLGLEAGDVEPLPLARTRMRWPGLRDGVRAMAEWTRSLGLGELLASREPALMACRGARYHFDAEHYGSAAFCNLFLSADEELDLHFPVAGRHMPLGRGTAVIFDTAQPHAVIARHGTGFDAADFADERARLQVFLSWELPIDHSGLARMLGIDFDTDRLRASHFDAGQVWRDGERVEVNPESGHWRPAVRA